MQKKKYDVLIIGSGGAGLSSAITAAQNNMSVAVISKVHPLKSHTVAAQGGINASLGNISSDDWRWHAHDTIKAGRGIADEDSVRYMCQSAPNIIKKLEKIGVEFDKLENGKINQKIYGGQSTNFGDGDLAHRACFSKDRTGYNIMHKLYKKAMSLGVKFYNYYFALDLLIENENCYGTLCWDIDKGKILPIFAN
ncbi:MAG: hypothetical protein DGJ47_001110, partial [Rickettsiaceae bacterium]